MNSVDLYNSISLANSLSGRDPMDVFSVLRSSGTSISSIAPTNSRCDHGYIVGFSENCMYVSFKATSRVRDILRDLNYRKSIHMHGFEGRIHSGFLELGLQIPLEGFLEFLEHTANNKARIVFSGHSLGGAIAVVVALRVLTILGMDPNVIHVYTFGTPPIGDDTFARYYDNHFRTNFTSFYNDGDIIPNLTSCISERGEEAIVALLTAVYNILAPQEMKGSHDGICRKAVSAFQLWNDLRNFHHIGECYSNASGTWSLLPEWVVPKVHKITSANIQKHDISSYTLSMRSWGPISDAICEIRDSHLINEETASFIPDITYSSWGVAKVTDVVVKSDENVGGKRIIKIAVSGSNLHNAKFFYQGKEISPESHPTRHYPVVFKNVQVPENAKLWCETLGYVSVFGKNTDMNYHAFVDESGKSRNSYVRSMSIAEILNLAFVYSAYDGMNQEKKSRLIVIMDKLEEMVKNVNSAKIAKDLGDLYDAYILHICNPNATTNRLNKLDSNLDSESAKSNSESGNHLPEHLPQENHPGGSCDSYHRARQNSAHTEISHLQTSLTKSISLRVITLLTSDRIYLSKANLLKRITPIGELSAVISATIAMVGKQLPLPVLINVEMRKGLLRQDGQDISRKFGTCKPVVGTLLQLQQ
ncbi:hypothetical protein K7432_016179 [Basidiobolus ranarum]|uniref:Fungal lipase-type domain-containing protein n=1 Tax=Basidiobolus ranarum TaxID=34480 RepID=A0ABR2WF41_9FUNG